VQATHSPASSRSRARATHFPASARSRARWLAALVACASLACVEAELPRPDLLLVTLDALPVDALACHGGRADVGRDLCSIADQGSRFVWAFAAADAPAPAAASLLTGEPPSLHRVGAGAAGFLRSEASTLAERLARAGYSTAAFVHQPELNRSRHFDQGFARFDDGAAPSSTLVSSGAHDAVSQAASWLATAPSPFFAWVHIGRGPGGDGAAATKGAAEMLGRLDRDLARLLAVLDARATPPAMLVTSLPGARSERLSTRLAPTATLAAMPPGPRATGVPPVFSSRPGRRGVGDRPPELHAPGNPHRC